MRDYNFHGYKRQRKLVRSPEVTLLSEAFAYLGFIAGLLVALALLFI